MISPFYRIKCLFGGEAGVGKSSLVHLIKHSVHNPNTEPTIAVEYAIQTVELKEYPFFKKDLPGYYFKEVTTNNCLQTIKTEIWDAAGSPRFKSIVSSYMRNLDIAFLVFSLSDRASWEALPSWKEEIDKNGNPMIVIVATKCDLKHQVDEVEISELCKKWNAKRFTLSAVQRNSPGMVKRMLYKSVQDYHEKILSLPEEEVPKHVKRSYFNHLIPRLNLDVEPSQVLCCNVQ